MKKLLVVLFSVLFLSACGFDVEENEEEGKEQVESEDVVAEEENSQLEKNTDEETVKSEDVTEDSKEQEELTSIEEIKEAIEYGGMGEDDSLEGVTFENGEITAEIKVVDDTFTPEQMAVTRYSQVSDYLLEFRGWEVLSIKYVGVGTISFNRDQAETNEYDMEFFPILEIENQINGN